MNLAASLERGEEAILREGAHLAEIALARPAADEAVLHALKLMGFRDVVLDLSTRAEENDAPLSSWGSLDSPSLPPNEGGDARRARFVGRLEAPLRIRNLPDVRWLYARTLTVDPYAEMKHDGAFPFPLRPGVLYEVRFLAWLRAQPTHTAVHAALETVGFRPLKILATKKDHRMPGKPRANFTEWCGLVRWAGPDSVITTEDPLYFERVTPVPEDDGREPPPHDHAQAEDPIIEDDVTVEPSTYPRTNHAASETDVEELPRLRLMPR